MTEITRRALLTGASATAAAVAVGTILTSSPTVAADTADQVAVDPDKDRKVLFSQLSAALTGIDDKILRPDVDPFQFNDEVFGKAQTADSMRLDRLLNAFKESTADPVKVDTLLSKFKGGPPKNPQDPHEYPDEDTRFLARSIILAWYLGAWYKPTELKKHSYQSRTSNYYSTRRYSPDILIPHDVISPNAYTRGMVWRIAQAHPMGYSNLQFGYWGDNPPDQLLFIKPLQKAPK
jgi:hypothetical protein